MQRGCTDDKSSLTFTSCEQILPKIITYPSQFDASSGHRWRPWGWLPRWTRRRPNICGIVAVVVLPLSVTNTSRNRFESSIIAPRSKVLTFVTLQISNAIIVGRTIPLAPAELVVVIISRLGHLPENIAVITNLARWLRDMMSGGMRRRLIRHKDRWLICGLWRFIHISFSDAVVYVAYGTSSAASRYLLVVAFALITDKALPTLVVAITISLTLSALVEIALPNEINLVTILIDVIVHGGMFSWRLMRWARSLLLLLRLWGRRWGRHRSRPLRGFIARLRCLMSGWVRCGLGRSW